MSLLFRSAFPPAWTAILNLPFGVHSGSGIENLNDKTGELPRGAKGQAGTGN